MRSALATTRSGQRTEFDPQLDGGTIALSIEQVLAQADRLTGHHPDDTARCTTSFDYTGPE